MQIVINALTAIVAVLNSLINRLHKPIVAKPAYIDPFTFRVAKVKLYGSDADGRFIKMEVGMPVDSFKLYYAHSGYSSYEQAAVHARNYSRIGELYAVTDDGIVVGIYCDGCIIAGYAYRG